jgi:tRNA nucleotidyltransferase (CCA-adding enzyme)
LHEASFIDDPTRIFRAVRFEQRFNFKIEPYTEELIKNAVDAKMFEKVGRHRIRDEIILILKEKNPIKSLVRMRELHELRFVHPRIVLDKKTLNILKVANETINYFSGKNYQIEAWIIYFMTLLERLSLKETQGLCNGFSLAKKDASRLLSYKEKGDSLLNFLKTPRVLKPSQIYRRLRGLSVELILLLYAKVKGSRKARMRIHSFLTKYSRIKLGIGGGDLKALGLSPGPRFKRVLEEALYAKIDGKLKTKKDEKDFVVRSIAKK